MAFFNKASNILRQTATKHLNHEIAASKPSIFQMIRCMSSSKIFVGGLSWGTDNESLREAFSKYGDVAEARVIQDRETGRSRGFGFVTYDTAEAASSAIQALDGQELHGRRIRVNYANDRSQGYGARPAYYGGGGDGYGGGEGYANSGSYSSSGGRYSNYASHGGDGYTSANSYPTAGYTTTGQDNYASGNYETGYNSQNLGSAGVGNSSADQFGNDSSTNMASTEGEYTNQDPTDGNFRDDDDDSGDYANRRA